MLILLLLVILIIVTIMAPENNGTDYLSNSFQVRKECGYLAGQFLTVEADKRKAKRLEKIQEECRKLQKKV